MAETLTIESRGRSQYAAALALIIGSTIPFLAGLHHDKFVGMWIAILTLTVGLTWLYSDIYEDSLQVIAHQWGLTLLNPWRFWGQRREWAWDEINRLEVAVNGADPTRVRVHMQVYAVREPQILRETLPFDPGLAQMIIDQAALKPDDPKETIEDFDNLPVGDDRVFLWKK